MTETENTDGMEQSVSVQFLMELVSTELAYADLRRAMTGHLLDNIRSRKRILRLEEPEEETENRSTERVISVT